jgi:hypothetical protein
MFETNMTELRKINAKTQSKPLAEHHGRGTEWELHGKCESASRSSLVITN